MKRARLTRQDWITTGLDVLVTAGPSALAAEPLARRLKTTKGSFYWHFNDVPDFHLAVTKDWQTRAFADVVAALSEKASVEQRLRRFGVSLRADLHDVAFRAWARTDAHVAHAVAQVDTERLTYLTNLLKQIGVSNPHFAQSCLATLIGLPQIEPANDPEQAFDALIDMVLALE